jgi:hypothetical protein
MNERNQMNDFDRACADFTSRLKHAANWKDHYMGAAYSTRLWQAIQEAKAAIATMEVALHEDNRTAGLPPYTLAHTIVPEGTKL